MIVQHKFTKQLGIISLSPKANYIQVEISKTKVLCYSSLSKLSNEWENYDATKK